MKKNYIFLAAAFLIAFSIILSCENPIMEPWWVEGERRQQSDSHGVFQSIRPITTEFIIFAGGSPEYNGPPVPASGTRLEPEQIATNKSTMAEVALVFFDNPNFWVNFHGHANPVDRTEEELEELAALSLARAVAVQKEFRNVLEAISMFSDNQDEILKSFDSRTRSTGYGGEHIQMNIQGQNNFLNRRVEIIVFAIDTHRN
jgi:hypothetical protein